MAENGYFSITANFNLREPKTRKPTNVYLVITINRVQYKFSLGVKVLPSQWHKKKQIAMTANFGKKSGPNK